MVDLSDTRGLGSMLFIYMRGHMYRGVALISDTSPT